MPAVIKIVDGALAKVVAQEERVVDYGADLRRTVAMMEVSSIMRKATSVTDIMTMVSLKPITYS